MEEVMRALNKIQIELDSQKNTILNSGEKITKTVTENINSMLEEKFNFFNEKYKYLNEKMENNEKRIYFLEKQARKNNVIFFGIQETENSYETLEKITTNFVRQYFSVDIDNRDIQEVKRIGKKGERPRPLIATFTTLGTKIKIIKQKNVALKGTNYYITEDYPKHVLEKRRELQAQVIAEREKGNLAFIKYDKLIIHDKNKQGSSNKRSRTLSSESPTKVDKQSHFSKKNKHQVHSKKTTDQSVRTGKPSILDYVVNGSQNDPSNSSQIHHKNNEK